MKRPHKQAEPTPIRGTCSVSVDPFYAEDLHQMERAVNYRRWQFEMVEAFLGERILEVGGGIGNFTCWLAENGREVVSVEPNGYCFEQLQEKTRKLGNVRTLQATLETMNSALEIEAKFDTIVMMNVLEHIEDDETALTELNKRLADDGRVVILVPAGSWAYGKIDERLGHFRRYSKRYSRALFARAGLNVEFIRYYNFIGMWGWWWNAKYGKLEGQSDAQIRFFDRWVVPMVSRLERWLPPPIGQSILIVGRSSALKL